MTSVGLDELRRRMDEYLEKVKQGASLTITEAGEPIAELRPPERVHHQTAASLVEAGIAEWDGVRPHMPMAIPGVKDLSVSDIVIQLREEEDLALVDAVYSRGPMPE